MSCARPRSYYTELLQPHCSHLPPPHPPPATAEQLVLMFSVAVGLQTLHVPTLVQLVTMTTKRDYSGRLLVTLDCTALGITYIHPCD